MKTTKTITREEWLNRLAQRLSHWFEDDELALSVPKIRLSVGFTSKGSRGKRIGECWAKAASKDGTCEIFVVPTIDDSERVADIVAHEMIHAVVGIDKGHGPAFKRVAMAIGLEGKMTATVAGPRFKARIAPILKALGPIPHAELREGAETSGPKKQGTRMIKCWCAECDYTVRTTKKWIEVAVPTCPVHQTEMEHDPIESEDDEEADA